MSKTMWTVENIDDLGDFEIRPERDENTSPSDGLLSDEKRKGENSPPSRKGG